MTKKKEYQGNKEYYSCQCRKCRTKRMRNNIKRISKKEVESGGNG